MYSIHLHTAPPGSASNETVSGAGGTRIARPEPGLPGASQDRVVVRDTSHGGLAVLALYMLMQRSLWVYFEKYNKDQ
jgi:hypothetical protein